VRLTKDNKYKGRIMTFFFKLGMFLWLCCSLCSNGLAFAAPGLEEFLATNSQPGTLGGKLVVAERSEPKTFNPVAALDSPSRDVIQRMTADLIHINRSTQRTEPALAKSWTISPDKRMYTLRLRRGIKFSDGHAFDADDVVFSFQVYLDEKVHSIQRDLLVIGGKPIGVAKLDQYTIRFDLPKPYASAERLFDSLAMLPRHLLEAAYKEGKFASSWGLNVAPVQIAGLGPFRFKEYVAGQRIVLEKNPYYWKTDSEGTRLPYLDQIVYILVPSEDAQVLRFEAGDTDILNRINAQNFAVLQKDQQARGFRLFDLGPGLEYNFLLFNLNDDTTGRLPEIARHQMWFREQEFRKAVSAAIDRNAIVQLVYQGRAVPLIAQVTPGNKLWLDQTLPRPKRSFDRAKDLLQSAGFRWKSDGTLIDASGQTVEFSILASANNAQRKQMATLIQADLKQLGITVQVVPMEFRAQLDRILQTHDYDAAIMALGSGDVDPTAEMNVWLSSGGTHLWHLGENRPATNWEEEIDRLMQMQESETDPRKRKLEYDQVQQVVASQFPIVCLVSPNILVGAKSGLANFQAAVLDHYTLWNVDELFWQPSR
jgi:peptide/nickel transport system substrate-binding protein